MRTQKDGYIFPEIEIVLLETADVITASGNGGTPISDEPGIDLPIDLF